jgi:type IV secretion system protein VirB11
MNAPAVSIAAALPQIPRASALELTLRSLRPILADPDVTELCINSPGECFVERQSQSAVPWERVPLAFANFDWCMRLAKLVANHSRQRIDDESALLSASLPSGERIQIVVPPACTAGTVAISIRRPAERTWSVGELADRGIFASTRPAESGPTAEDQKLRTLLEESKYEAFVAAAVRARKNIIVSGPTGSGKTTFTKALILEIPPTERLITIEDAAELVLDRHPNHVRLFYSKDGQGLAKVTPKRLLESCLRMKPDRILLAELRGEEAYDYLRNVCSGHPGSITSVHAASAELAFEQLMLLVKQNPAGRELPRAEIQTLLHRLIDVVIQFGIEGSRRTIREIWFEPDRAQDTTR